MSALDKLTAKIADEVKAKSIKTENKVEEVSVTKMPSGNRIVDFATQEDMEFQLKQDKEASKIAELALWAKRCNEEKRDRVKVASCGLTDLQIKNFNRRIKATNPTLNVDIADVEYTGFNGVIMEDVITNMSVSPLLNVTRAKTNMTEAIGVREMIAQLANTELTPVTDTKDKTLDFIYKDFKLKVSSFISYEAVENADIDWLMRDRQGHSIALAKAWERALISGDSVTVGHMDAGLGYTAGDSVFGCRGLRYLGLNKNPVDWGGATLTEADILKYITDMIERGGDYLTWDQVDAGKVVMVVNTDLYNQFLRLGIFTDANRSGAGSTVVNGKRINTFMGVRIVPSRWMPSLVDATGVNSIAGPNTLQSCVMFNTDYIKAYYTADPRNGFFDNIDNDSYQITSSMRVGFASVFDQLESNSDAIDSTRNNVVSGINIARSNN